jgi:hypothetical protein
LVEYSGLMEKKDACYYKVKASAKVWPSAYASGRLVQSRKKGAANYGNKSEGVAEGGAKDRQWSNKDMEKLRVATRDFDDILSADGPDATKQDLIKKRIQTKPMAGPKGVLPEQGMSENTKQEILFYAKLPDGSKVYARIKDAEQLGDLQQQYRGAEIKTFDYNRPDILDWLEARGINLRKFTPGMVQTMYPGSRGHPGSTGLNEFAPGGGGNNDGSDGFSDGDHGDGHGTDMEEGEDELTVTTTDHPPIPCVLTRLPGGKGRLPLASHRDADTYPPPIST